MTLERPGRFFLLALAGVLLLAVAERRVRSLRTASEAGRGGCWIWAPGVARSPEPVAFFAVRDFELPAASGAALEIAADEGYELYLNGRPVGANSYRAGMAIDRYAVGDLLRAGRNRITVALRSTRGAGGLLAALVAGDRTVVTDGEWRIFRRQEPELFDPDATLAIGEAPEVWQRSPTGRWRLRPAEVDHARVFEGSGPPPNRFPIRARSVHPEAPWKRLRRRQLQLPVRSSQVLLDWGREVEGFLSFALQRPPGGRGGDPQAPGGEPRSRLFRLRAAGPRRPAGGRDPDLRPRPASLARRPRPPLPLRPPGRRPAPRPGAGVAARSGDRRRAGAAGRRAGRGLRRPAAAPALGGGAAGLGPPAASVASQPTTRVARLPLD